MEYYAAMIRVHSSSFAGRAVLALAASFLVGALACAPAFAQAAKPDPKKQQAGQKPAAKKPDPKKPAKPDPKKPATAGKPAAAAAAAPTDPGKPALVQSYGDWGAYAAKGAKARTCYALATPKERLPASLKRDPAYLFVSQRPGEGVRNEISFVMGFDVKPNSSPKAEIGNVSFDLVAKGGNLWIKNAAEEAKALDVMRKGARIVVKAQSLRGNLSTDSYSLSGLAQALDRVQKECQ